MGNSSTVYSVGEAIQRKPDCALCGRPYSAHSGGYPNTCPIIATYRPIPLAHPTPGDYPCK